MKTNLYTIVESAGRFILIPIEDHFSDAALQAWTWAFFRDIAAELGGGEPRDGMPTFSTEEGARKWVADVIGWFAIVHPGSGFDVSGEPRHAVFANRTTAALGRYGAEVKTATGEDLGWQPITWGKDRWEWQDGPYGVIDHFAELEPRRGDESEDDFSERMHGKASEVEALIVKGLEAGLVEQTLENGLKWKLQKLEAYDVKI